MSDYYPCEICDTDTNADNGHVCDNCYNDVMGAFNDYANEGNTAVYESSNDD